MPGYQYRGNNFAVVDEIKLPNGVFDPSRCGTYANYRQHTRYQVPMCDACRQAYNAYERDLAARKRALREVAA